jgi:hypothetical protein
MVCKGVSGHGALTFYNRISCTDRFLLYKADFQYSPETKKKKQLLSAYCIHNQKNHKALRAFEKSVNVYQLTRHDISKDLNQHGTYLCNRERWVFDSLRYNYISEGRRSCFLRNVVISMASHPKKQYLQNHHRSDPQMAYESVAHSQHVCSVLCFKPKKSGKVSL